MERVLVTDVLYAGTLRLDIGGGGHGKISLDALPLSLAYVLMGVEG